MRSLLVPSRLAGADSLRLCAFRSVCASTSIIRSPSRVELLYARSRLVLAAKAFNIPAIDMVSFDRVPRVSLSLASSCVSSPADVDPCIPATFLQVCINYKDETVLKEECEEGRRLGFDGKVRTVPLLFFSLGRDLHPQSPKPNPSRKHVSAVVLTSLILPLPRRLNLPRYPVLFAPRLVSTLSSKPSTLPRSPAFNRASLLRYPVRHTSFSSPPTSLLSLCSTAICSSSYKP